MASKIEVREDGKYLDGVRVYSKNEAATILECAKMYVSKLVDQDKIHEIGYAPYREGVETLALFVDADSVDAYKLIFRHKDDNAPHQYVIELIPEDIERYIELTLITSSDDPDDIDAIDRIAKALKDAKDLTEARRKYYERKAKAKEGVTEGRIEKA